MPKDGGVITRQAENGSPELDLNLGSSGQPVMREFAAQLAGMINGQGGGNTQVNIVIKTQDDIILAEKVARVFNNGLVEVELN